MKITLNKKEYIVLDTIEKITIPDCFVVRQNKIGTGNGEAKLYLGQDNQTLHNFFGQRGFIIKAFVYKKDLKQYLVETKAEYLKAEQNYAAKDEMPLLWQTRMNLVESMPEVIEFEFFDQKHIIGPRVYGKGDPKDKNFKLIRELSLPNITYISVLKLQDLAGNIFYYFKLFADFFGETEHPAILIEQMQELQDKPQNTQTERLTKARIGQGKYREQLLESCPFCPITLVGDDRILIASHIKPWSSCIDDKEKLDPYNGFMFTPTFDKLFDKGFISFSNEKRVILSPFLSKLTYSRLGIKENQLFDKLPVEKREKYLAYHREFVLK